MNDSTTSCSHGDNLHKDTNPELTGCDPTFEQVEEGANYSPYQNLKYLFIISFLLLSNNIAHNQTYEQCYFSDIQVQKTLSVKASHYHALQGQTDSTPLLTASGRIIDTNRLREEKIKWIALSRDLLTTFNKGALFTYGDYIEISGIGKLSGRYLVADCMAEQYRQKIDILVHHKTQFKHFEKATITFNQSLVNYDHNNH